ncbi:hypothetical protein DTO013E5_10120 [Penicillium roqueforti]|uniref:Uncharacterized protein n=4 Tax=Penicillium TaxID=5073 RepID=A0A1V6WI77_PENNA|nr:hypothetical protein DTO013F2_10168 [Penicillium roqueforti]OQE62445.1 hypothetical protein PENNAL_c0266G05044 [Penicillium nalgiovense]CAG7951897.1 unnamed protein product [Penicillium salamii]CRL30759.1 unnamed protein product [Penicillium camemberti]KAI2736247.1 hypothetical protein DTO012A1_8578 [Penicillium roqueforti]
MPSRRSAAQVLASSGQDDLESGVAPGRNQHSTVAGPDTGPLPGPQGANMQRALGIQSASPIVKAQKKHWTAVHRKCLHLFKEADREQEESARTLEQLETDKAQAAEHICQLSDEKNKNIAEIQKLEMQILNLKQQLEAAPSNGMGGDDGMYTLMHLGTTVNILKTDIDKEVEARRNKRLAAGMPDSDVLQANWSVQNGQMGLFDVNALPSYSLPSTLSLANQQALPQFHPQSNQYQSSF